MNQQLRIAVINHVHPERPHVSALRMRMFAEHLARAGDHVVLLSGPRDDDDRGVSSDDLPELIKDHNWTSPLFISCKPNDGSLQSKAREGHLPPGIRQAVIGWSYLTTGGVFSDWRKSAELLLPTLASSLKPDIVFATFGNTDSWSIAQSLARHAGCPWIGDKKDNWSAFIPYGFRKMTADRYADMAQMTAYSESHKAEGDRWFNAEKTVIYSGYDHSSPTSPVPAEPIENAIVIAGSLYDNAHLKILCDGIRQFCANAQGHDLSLIYAGNDGALFERIAGPELADIIEVNNAGHLDPGTLFSMQAAAMANVYIVNPNSLFQQKLLELLAARKPIIAIPHESTEAHKIAKDSGGILLNCPNTEAVSAALQSCNVNDTPVPQTELTAYSWQAQTQRLRNVMQCVIESAP